MIKYIYNDDIGMVTNKVSTVKICESNLNEENRMKFVTDLAAISRGKTESNNPAKRYQSLLKEAAFNVTGDIANASRPLEFLPIVLQVNIDEFGANFTDRNGEPIWEMNAEDFMNNVMPFSYINNDLLYTNMRALFNADMPYESIPYNTVDEISDFRAVKVKVPMFVFNHLITHTKLSKEARSERMVDLNTCDYWLPQGFRKRVYDYISKFKDADGNTDMFAKGFNNIEMNFAERCLQYNNSEDLIRFMLSGDMLGNFRMGQSNLMSFFKELGYPKEIYQRAMLEFRYKDMIITGWFNDPKTFNHLFLERNAKQDEWKNWTQNETSITVNAIKEIVDNTTKFD